MFIITNNKLVYDTYQESWKVDFYESFTLLNVLEKCRDEVHLGRKILTHPLTGSVKPNETPFKSVMLSSEYGELDLDSLSIIENAIEVTNKFLANHQVKDWPDKILEDFRLIDFGLIRSGIESVG